MGTGNCYHFHYFCLVFHAQTEAHQNIATVYKKLYWSADCRGWLAQLTGGCTFTLASLWIILRSGSVLFFRSFNIFQNISFAQLSKAHAECKCTPGICQSTLYIQKRQLGNGLLEMPQGDVKYGVQWFHDGNCISLFQSAIHKTSAKCYYSVTEEDLGDQRYRCPKMQGPRPAVPLTSIYILSLVHISDGKNRSAASAATHFHFAP